MAKKEPLFTEEEIAHITRLRKHPELLERFAAILEISDGEEGEIKSADEVEALLIEEVRKLGRASMGEWAKETEARAGAQHQKKNPGSYCGKKTAELVVRFWEGGGAGASLEKFVSKLPESILRSHRCEGAEQEPCAPAGFERLRRGACLCSSGCEGQGTLRV